MNALQFSDEILTRIRDQEGRYDERAYLFVLAAIEFLQSRLTVRRHVTGQELAWACRDFAIRQFGLLAPEVLGFWGVRRTDDFGRIVYVLIGAGLLSTQPTDREEDFAAVFEFAEAFAGPYEWEGLSRL